MNGSAVENIDFNKQFPDARELGPDASETDLKTLIAKHGQGFIKPVLKGGVDKNGKAGLVVTVLICIPVVRGVAQETGAGFLAF